MSAHGSGSMSRSTKRSPSATRTSLAQPVAISSGVLGFGGAAGSLGSFLAGSSFALPFSPSAFVPSSFFGSASSLAGASSPFFVGSGSSSLAGGFSSPSAGFGSYLGFGGKR